MNAQVTPTGTPESPQLCARTGGANRHRAAALESLRIKRRSRQDGHLAETGFGRWKEKTSVDRIPARLKKSN